MTKQEFDTLYVGEKKVVHCPTKELAYIFLKEANKHGYKWHDEDSYLENDQWNIYKKQTCYNLYTGSFANIDFYKKLHYEIIKFKSFRQTYLLNKLSTNIYIKVKNHNFLLKGIYLLKKVYKLYPNTDYFMVLVECNDTLVSVGCNNIELTTLNKTVNYLEQILEMLDVTIGEEFKINTCDSIYKFNNKELLVKLSVNNKFISTRLPLNTILKYGIKKQWKPKLDEKYWSVDLGRAIGINDYLWGDFTRENNLLKHNAVFKTKEEAEKAHQAVLKTLENLKESKK